MRTTPSPAFGCMARNCRVRPWLRMRNRKSETGLGAFDVLSLPALRAFDHVKLNLLAFLQAAESTGLNGGEMYEDILAVLAADKTVALGVINPLHCSCFHDGAYFLCC